MKRIDMADFPRRDHFNHFCGMAYPYVGVTAEADVTALYRLCKRTGWSFYTVMIHAAALAADEVPELRQRIDQGGIVEYDACPTSHTELKADGSYAYCTLRHRMPLAEYLAQAEAARAAARLGGSIEEAAEVQSMYFISTLPGVRYTALIQPVCGGEDSNPRITWGKYQHHPDGRVTLPLSLLAHHALVDGLHIARFYEAFDKQVAKISEEAEACGLADLS